MQHQTEERATCKMTPEQLLGLQRHARMKSETLTPEISILDPDAPVVAPEPSVVVEVPMLVVQPPRKSTSGRLGAVIGFSLLAMVTTADVLISCLS